MASYETNVEYVGAKQFLDLLMKCEEVSSRIEKTFERISRIASGISMPTGGGGGRGSGGGSAPGGGGRSDGGINISVGRIGGSGGGGGPSGPTPPSAGGSPWLPVPQQGYGANASDWFSVGTVGGGSGKGIVPHEGSMDVAGKFLAGLSSLLPELLLAAALLKTAAMIVRFDDNRSAYIREQAAGGYYGGGTAKETAAQASLGGFMGMSSSQIGQFAEQFGSRLQQGGFGSAFMRSNGVTDLGMYTIDKSANLLKAVDLLTHIKSNTEALVVARTLGLEPFLGLRDTDAMYRERLMHSMQPLTDSDKREANDYAAQRQSLQNNLDAKQNWLFTHVFGPLGRLGLGSIENAISGPRSDKPDYAYWIKRLSPWGVGQAMDWFGSQFGGTGNESRDKALKDNTDAIRNHTRALKDGTDWSGGNPMGHRRFGAKPKGWVFNQFEDALQGQAQMLGAFAI